MQCVKLIDGTVIETNRPEFWKEGERMTAKAGKAAMVEQCKDKLRERIEPGAAVYTILRHVSGSGTSRRISVVIMFAGELMDVSGWVACVLGYKRHDRDGALIVSGWGKDMGFHVVYSLGRALFHDGFKVDGVGRNGDTSGYDRDGGYALKHRWL